MTNRDVALVGFKLVGFWLIATTAIGLAGLPYFWHDSRLAGLQFTAAAVMLLPALVGLAIGVPVWFSADWFAARLFPSAEPEDLRAERLRAEPVLALALSIFGIFLVCESIPAVVNAATLFSLSRQTGSAVFGPDAAQRDLVWSAAGKANGVAAIVRLLIGLTLLAGPARWSATLARVRKDLRGSLTEEAPNP